ncbi:unnamed protein product [Calypogeia fissa]
MRRSQDPREQCCGSLDRESSMMGGMIPNYPSSVHQCSMRLEEHGENAVTVRRSPPSSTVPLKSHHVDQANVKHGFWSELRQNEASPVEPKAAPNKDHCLLPSRFDHQANSFSKPVVTKQHSSKASHLLSVKVENLEIQEIERLKAQMALLCERLAWHVSRCSKGQRCCCKAGDEVHSFDSDEESLLLKGILGELNNIVITSVPTGRSESRRRLDDRTTDSDIGQASEYSAGGHHDMMQEYSEICRSRNLAWKSGINTLFQALLWCIGFLMTIVRCTNSVPLLLPT